MFQFGDFYNQSSMLNSWLIEFFKVAVAAALFFAGIYFTSRKEDNASKKANKELRKSIYSFIKSLKIPFDIQIASIREVIEQIRTDDQQDYVFPEVPSFNMRGVKSFQYNDLFKAFVTKIEGNEIVKIESFNKFNNSVEYFNKVVEKSIPKYSNSFYKKVVEFNKDFKDNANIVFELLRTYALMPEQDEVSMGFRDIGAKYVKAASQYSGLKNSYFAYGNAILPLLDLCNRNLDDNRCQGMMNYLINCKISIEIFNRNRSFYIQQFTDLLETMQVEKQKLDSSLGELEKMER